MEEEHQEIRGDIIKRTALYQWFRKKSWAQKWRDILRFTWLLSPWEAWKISHELWNEPGHLVKVRPPSLNHPVILRSCTSDSRVFHEIFSQGIYNFGLPPRASLIIDAGANIGLASVFFANRYSQATILAVEPSGPNVTLLRQNIAPYPHVTIREAGLWHKKEPLHFLNPTADFWAFRVEPCKPEEANFPSVTIPELLEAHGQTPIDILKMDIEGSERQLLLEGDASWLDRVNLLIIELHGDLARERFGEVKTLLEKHGLHLVRGGENCFFRRDIS